MKFVKTIIALMLVVNSVRSGTKDVYDMALFGDNGQVEYFLKNKFPHFMEGKDAQKKFIDRLMKEEFEYDSKGCSLKDPKENKILVDFSKEQGMVNFEKILKNENVKKLLENCDSGAILGDILYVENKFSIGKNKAIRFAKVLHIGDYKESESDYGLYFAEGTDKEYTDKEVAEKWIERINCGWHLFNAIVQKHTKDWKKPIINAQGQLNNRFWLLGGNHSFDADIKAEEKFILTEKRFKGDELGEYKAKHYVNHIVLDGEHFDKTKWLEKDGSKNLNDNHLTRVPRLISNFDKNKKTEIKGPKVQILDFNSQLFACLFQLQGEIDAGTTVLEDQKHSFTKCQEQKKYIHKGNYPTLEEARNYLQRVTKGIKSFETGPDVWRVMRAHHPPVNIEDKDEEIYWTDITVDVKGNKIKLIDLMQKNKVQIFLASHHHSGMSLIYNYEKGKKCKDAESKEKIQLDQVISQLKDKNTKLQAINEKLVNLEKVETDKAKLETEKAKLEIEKANLDTEKADLETLKKELEAKHEVEKQCRRLNPDLFDKNGRKKEHAYTIGEACINSANTNLGNEGDHPAPTYNFGFEKEKPQQRLFIFITGNSGRKFDPIASNEGKTRAMLVWGRAVGTNYGFSKAEVTKDTFTIKYYELEKETLKLTSVFNVKNNEKQDDVDKIFDIETKYLEKCGATKKKKRLLKKK